VSDFPIYQAHVQDRIGFVHCHNCRYCGLPPDAWERLKNIGCSYVGYCMKNPPVLIAKDTDSAGDEGYKAGYGFEYTPAAMYRPGFPLCHKEDGCFGGAEMTEEELTAYRLKGASEKT
jgi:hypothetical protein